MNLKPFSKNLTLGLLALLLSSCGDKGYEAATLQSKSQTGHQTSDGKNYVVGKEDRLQEAKFEVVPNLPVEGTPIKMTPEEEKKVKFHQTLKEFRLLRYSNNSDSPVRLGQDRYTFEILLETGPGSNKLLNFSGHLKKSGNKLEFSNTSQNDSEYSLEGSLEDNENRVTGKMTLRFNNESATVLYSAYEAQLNVRTPKDKNLEEHVNLSKKIEALKNNTKAWVNNFSVPYGVATFDVAIIKIHSVKEDTPKKTDQETDQPDISSLLHFSGRSVETDVENVEEEKVSLAKDSKDQDLESISLVGNAEGEDSKIFAAVLKDDKGENTEILIDVEREKTEEEIKEEKKKEEKLREDFLFDPIFNSSGEDLPTPTPRPNIEEETRNSEKPSQSSLGNNEKSYMYARSGSNALKIIKDFEKNFSLSGVQNQINKIKNSSAEVNKLKAFFKHANPFRGMIESVAQAYGVPPQYAYVTLIESRYFYGGNYKIEVAPTTTATGPFQFVIATARGLGMRVDGRQNKGAMPSKSDERRYFAPSACAAAKYFRNNIKNYFSKDATLAITAYYQGEGKVGGYARRYGYTYAELSKHNIRGIRYTDKKLATYFLAGKYTGSKFDVDSQSSKTLPSSTVFPAQSIKDSTCKNAVQ